jgi:hypothetical protein
MSLIKADFVTRSLKFSFVCVFERRIVSDRVIKEERERERMCACVS